MTDGQVADADVVVIGAGVAGLSAALSAAEQLRASGGEKGRVVLLEKAEQQEAGGNTKWTDAYFRLADVYEPADGFAEDMAAFSHGKTDTAYVAALLEHLPEAMEWVQSHGVRFHRRPTYFVTASRPRMMPVGGGESLQHKLTEAFVGSGGIIRYGAAVTGMQRADDGWLLTCAGAGRPLAAKTCVVASGGFEGSPELLAEHLGEAARIMKPIAPGGAFNTGDVIEAAVGAGAATSGEWSNFHGEPVDRRSSQPEASVMVFPYGILVNNSGLRFVDEGIGTVDETYEDLSRAILAQPDCWAGLIADASFLDVPGIERGLLTDRKPFQADSLQELAEALGLEPEIVTRTVEEFNAAERVGEYDPTQCDGLHTVGLTPPKSNWARRIETPPFLGIPLTVDIVFTYGGLATDEHGRVLGKDGKPMAGMYAAGECTGIYYHKYPGATSVLRGLVYGRIAGLEAATAVAGAYA